VLDAKCLAGFVEELGAVGRPVVGQEALEPDALGREVLDPGFEEGDRRGLTLVGTHLHEAGSGAAAWQRCGA
jgi:hypothetical protein